MVKFTQIAQRFAQRFAFGKYAEEHFLGLKD